MTSSVVLILLATILALVYAVPINNESTFTIDPVPLVDKSAYRLPTTIWPQQYTIELRPYMLASDEAKRFTFDGKVHITIIPNQNTKTIKMHSKNLNYTVREYWEDSASERKALPNALPNADTDVIEYNLDTDLVAGRKYVLFFAYSGSMGDDMNGFYRSSYTDSKNITKWLASTQFQRNHARRAFPSFDEPKFKAEFELLITRHKSMKTVSNTHISQSTKMGDYITDRYQATPKMSSYLLAFIVSEFNERYDGQFGVLARPEYYHQTEYAYDVGQELLKAFDVYFGVPYYQYMDKMHMAAIPDFSAGAMENWGLLTYRERSLLYDPEESTLNAKQVIAGIIAHEQAHMWFGDLVTCDWWSETWLNEGFARFFQYYGTSWVEKELLMDHQFVVAQVQTVMQMDSTNSTNPMTEPDTFTPAELSRMFNSISYNKGASFIRMTESILGAQQFQISLNEYLETHKFNTTVPEDLFTIWRKYWPLDFSTFADAYMTSFTTQVGYPVVYVNISTDGRSFRIWQERFLLDKTDGSDSSLLYTVPITYTHDQEKKFDTTAPKFFLEATTQEKVVDLPTNVSWLIVNVQEIGYYRVNYDEMHWHRIHHALYKTNWDGIHELNRAQIVDDIFNLARSDVIKYELALAVLEYLETETKYSPWTAAFSGYSFLSIRLGTDLEKFNLYINTLMEKAYNKLGFNSNVNDTTLDIYLRNSVLSWACRYGNSDCVDQAYTHYRKMIYDGTPVPVNIRSVVYCSALRFDDKGHHLTQLRNKYLTETIPTESTLLLNSLGCVKNASQIEEVFNMILSDEVRRQDKSSTLTSLYTSNNENVWPVYKLTTEHFEKLAEVMGGYSPVASVVSGMASHFTEEKQKKDLESFIDKNGSKFGASVSTLEAAVRSVTKNLEWSDQKLGTIRNYLTNFRNGASSLIGSTTILIMVVISFLLR